MAWTAARTWTTGELVTASIMNTHVRDNLLYLAQGNRTIQEPTASGTDYTTTSTSFVDVDATEWDLSITPSASATAVKVWAQFFGMVNTDGAAMYVDITRDGTRIANTANGLQGMGQPTANRPIPWHVAVIDTGITASTAHSYKLQWRVSSGTGSIKAQSGDYPLLVAEEVGT